MRTEKHKIEREGADGRAREAYGKRDVGGREGQRENGQAVLTDFLSHSYVCLVLFVCLLFFTPRTLAVS